MVKPFLHPVTLEKISIFGFDKSEWTAALLKEIDADQLPVHYGGTMTDSDGDPKCSGKVCDHNFRLKSTDNLTLSI